jgi:hypothetical protein
MLDSILDAYSFSTLSTTGKVVVVVGHLILMLSFGGMVRYLEQDFSSDITLRKACESSPPFASPANLFEHFPKDTYSGRCLPEINTCGEFTPADGRTRHYPCENGYCTMYWQLDGHSCSVQLSTRGKALRPGEFKRGPLNDVPL